MENEINIAEILKDCSKGTKLYTPLFGEVTFGKDEKYSIIFNSYPSLVVCTSPVLSNFFILLNVKSPSVLKLRGKVTEIILIKQIIYIVCY